LGGNCGQYIIGLLLPDFLTSFFKPSHETKRLQLTLGPLFAQPGSDLLSAGTDVPDPALDQLAAQPPGDLLNQQALRPRKAIHAEGVVSGLRARSVSDGSNEPRR